MGRILEFIDILEAMGRRGKCIELIVTTGLSPDEYSHYNG